MHAVVINIVTMIGLFGGFAPPDNPQYLFVHFDIIFSAMGDSLSQTSPPKIRFCRTRGSEETTLQGEYIAIPWEAGLPSYANHTYNLQIRNGVVFYQNGPEVSLIKHMLMTSITGTDAQLRLLASLNALECTNSTNRADLINMLVRSEFGHAGGDLDSAVSRAMEVDIEQTDGGDCDLADPIT